MSVIFEITDQSGSVHVGHVQGNGGPLGGNAVTGAEGARKLAKRDMDAFLAHVNRTGEMPNDMARAPGGCCLVYPLESVNFETHQAFKDAIKEVPLKDASYRILN